MASRTGKGIGVGSRKGSLFFRRSHSQGPSTRSPRAHILFPRGGNAGFDPCAVREGPNAKSRHEDQRGAMTGVACDDLFSSSNNISPIAQQDINPPSL